MPKWGWWIAGFALFVFWNTHSMSQGYTLVEWWRAVNRRPLGDWRLIDLVPFFGSYVTIRLIAMAVVFLREIQIEQKPSGDSQPPRE